MSTCGTAILKHVLTSFVWVFQLSCEALGSPDPRIEWLKDGQVVNDPSKHVEGHGSILDLSFLSSSDSGMYTCRASNLLSQVDITFTLEVSGSSPYPPGNGINKFQSLQTVLP